MVFVQNTRTIRIENELKKLLSEFILTEVKDPGMSSMASITKVSMTSDLKFAKIYVSVYDTEKKRESTIKTLNRAAGFIRTSLSKRISIRRMPQLTFVLDTSIEYSVNISRLIDQVTQIDESKQQNAPETAQNEDE